MTTELFPIKKEDEEEEHRQGGSSGAVYGLGLIGAWVYYISRAQTLREGVAGFFKGLVWPALLVYKLFEYLEKK